MVHWFLGDALGVLSCPFWSTVLPCGPLLPIHTFDYRTVQSVVQVFLTGVCLSVTLHIIGLWQYNVCCTRSGVIRCTLFMVLYLCRCRIHAAQSLHIGMLARLLAAETLSIAGFLFVCKYLRVTILVTQYSMV